MRTPVLELLSALLIASAIAAYAPEADPSQHVDRVQEQLGAAPELVLIGNSMLGEGVDAARLTAQLGLRTSVVWRGGAGSAWWTAALKNHVLRHDPAPKAVVIAFRDTFLTQPTFRVEGAYGDAVRALQDPEEPLLDAHVWRPALGALPLFVRQHVPLARKRGEIQRRVDDWLTKTPTAILTRKRPSVIATATRETFAEPHLLRREVTRAQLQAERTTDTTQFAFAKRLRESLLPAMADEAQRAGVRLILVRIRRRAQAEGLREPALASYVQALKAWAAERGVPLLDFAEEGRLTPALFASGDHLNAEGRALFSDLLAERLAPLVR